MKIVSLWRYPVKSMMGEELSTCDITEKGLLGDRAYGVIDKETGKRDSSNNYNPFSSLVQKRNQTTKKNPNSHMNWGSSFFLCINL